MESNRGLILLTLMLLFGAARIPADDGPMPPPLRTEMSREELAAAALRYSPEYTQPVLNADGSPVAIYHELNGDGFTDAAILSVLSEPGVPTTMEALRQNSRLFRRGDPHALFVLETYFAGDEAVQTVELGRRPVLGGMELLQLSTRDPFPVAVAVRTRSAAGTENNMVIYASGGMIRRLQLLETERERYELGDLDGNGTLDIVVSRRLPEAGRGYETFVEFFSLDGGAYVLQASFGLVRELQQFLRTAEARIVESDWSGLAQLIRGDASDVSSLLADAFRGVADDQELDASLFDYPDGAPSIEDVVFPSLMESPLPYPYLGERFTLVFRVECCEGYPRFYSAIVALSQNPFKEPPFAFLTHDRAQQ